MPFPCELPKWEPTENGDTLHTHTHTPQDGRFALAWGRAADEKQEEAP